MTFALPGDTAIALCWIDLDAALPADWPRLVSAVELARSQRFATTQLRRRFVNGRLAQRALLGELLGLPMQQVPIVENPNGKPLLGPLPMPDAGPARHTRPGLPVPFAFNMANSGALGVCVLACTQAVGVDLELPRPIDDLPALTDQHMDADESQALQRAAAGAPRLHAFLHGWTRKEACLKAWGSGLGELDTRTIATGVGGSASRVPAPAGSPRMPLVVAGVAASRRDAGAAACRFGEQAPIVAIAVPADSAIARRWQRDDDAWAQVHQFGWQAAPLRLASLAAPREATASTRSRSPMRTGGRPA